MAFFVHEERLKGFPFDRERVFLWLMAALAIACVGRPLKQIGWLILDWLPFGLLLVAYDFSRGLADDIGAPIRRQMPIRIEKFLFFGHLPTVELQRLFFPKGPGISIWEEVVSLTYASHFVVPFLTAAILWARSRTEWRRYVNRFMVICVAGLITYVVLPVAPPWLAAQEGLIPAVQRPVGRGWGRLGFTAATRLLDEGRAVLNPVAAIPSLHAAYSMLLVAFFWKRIANPVVRWATVVYPIVMGFSLVYGAEHYVIDVLIGWLYVWFSFILCRRIERWWTQHQLTRHQLTGDN